MAETPAAALGFTSRSKVSPAPDTPPEGGGKAPPLSHSKTFVNKKLQIALRRSNAQTEKDKMSVAESRLFMGAVAAAQNTANKSASAPKMSQESSSIVDMNEGSALTKRIGKLFRNGRAFGRKRGGMYGSPAPREWTGASKLVRDVGDTVISVAISDDDRCSPLCPRNQGPRSIRPILVVR